jgi:pyruvate dehydrogenase E2 component (dihydrolipoamide acetyltransferase)
MATMLTIVPMPQMGVSVIEGTVAAWHKAAGDAVGEGDILCDIVTDKVDTEVTAPVAGVVVRIVADVGETVAVGAPLAELAPPGSTDIAAEATPVTATEDAPGPDAQATAGASAKAPASAAAAPAADAPAEQRAAAPATVHPSRFDPAAAAEAAVPAAASPNGAPRSSPVARRLATDHEVDLAAVRGSGRRGRIRKADVLAVLEDRRQRLAAPAPPPAGATGAPLVSPAPPPPAPAAPVAAPGELPRGYDGVPYAIVPTSPQRRAIAEHMVRSRHTAAHMTTEVEVDMHRVTRVRAELNAEREVAGRSRLSYLSFIGRATCAALGDFPDLNATFESERLIRWREVNLGIAVDTERGLLVPVIRGCDRLNVMGIGDAIADIAERTRSRKLTPDDMAGGTFTVSNPGSVGATSAMAIINQPQVAILGTPAIVKRPWVVSGPEGEDVIVPRPIMQLALTFDHRAVDGADATRCAVRIKQYLEGWDAAAYA